MKEWMAGKLRSTHGRLRNEMPGSFPVMKNQIDFNNGELKETNNPSDLAVQGDGFFALMNTSGERIFTRDGQFYINSAGRMVNSMGHEFSDEGGNTIDLVPGGGDPSIDQEGKFFRESNLLLNSGSLFLKSLSSNYRKWVAVLLPKMKTSNPK